MELGAVYREKHSYLYIYFIVHVQLHNKEALINTIKCY